MKKLRLQLATLPNQLTISRVLLTPVIIVVFYFPGRWTCLVAGLLFALAAITDLVDGWLARKDNQITVLGKFLDPLADKILISSMLIMLVQHGWIEAWIAIVIICRDIMVTGLRAVAADEGVVIAADKYGKAKTVVQIVAITPLLWHYDWFFLPMHSIGIFLLYIAMLLTVLSGGNYFWNFYKNWREISSSGDTEGR
jgi:CDP-diacylglycerol--glycerol-3-phosphate 3-phosphatidyltransferase